jgi:hypothetical protein
MAIHELLAQRTVAESQRLQVALGKIRRVSGDYQGKLLAIDPHRVRSYSKRQMRRHREDPRSKALKMAQTFFALDPDTHQPVCFTTAAIELLDLAGQILCPQPGQTLVMADLEHQTAELINHVRLHTPFDLLVPMKNVQSLQKQLRAIAPDRFIRQWAGFSTLKQPYQMAKGRSGELFQFAQRNGERPDDYRFGAFLCTTDRDEVDALTLDYPKRWHVEEFFNTHQALGWGRAGTMNLNIRYGQMTMALLAQAALHQLRRRLGDPFANWDAGHLARSLLGGLDGDVRVEKDTIVVTYYNAPNVQRLRDHYQELPDRLASENINPRIPWLYDFKLDFRFR